MAKSSKTLDDAPSVDAYMAKLDHPFKAEVAALRTIILNAHKKITEGVKWNAPSFFYEDAVVVFNLHEKGRVHLVFPRGAEITDTTGLLEGDYQDGRRMAYFASMDEINAKKAALEKVVQAWVKYMDQ